MTRAQTAYTLTGVLGRRLASRNLTSIEPRLVADIHRPYRISISLIMCLTSLLFNTESTLPRFPRLLLEMSFHGRVNHFIRLA